MRRCKSKSIYGLFDPRDDLFRYIGQARNPLARLEQHRQAPTSLEIKCWLQDLRVWGLKPQLEVIEDEIYGKREVDRREKYWIKYYEHLHHPLLNTNHSARERTTKGICAMIPRETFEGLLLYTQKQGSSVDQIVTMALAKLLGEPRAT